MQVELEVGRRVDLEVGRKVEVEVAVELDWRTEVGSQVGLESCNLQLLWWLCRSCLWRQVAEVGGKLYILGVVSIYDSPRLCLVSIGVCCSSCLSPHGFRGQAGNVPCCHVAAVKVSRGQNSRDPQQHVYMIPQEQQATVFPCRIRYLRVVFQQYLAR